jgi:eukaryotic-like serine/threonine-protein kinase
MPPSSRDPETPDAAALTATSTRTAEPDIGPILPRPRPAREPEAVLPRHDSERYEIIQEHARGGLGRIVRAHDHKMRRQVALKELLSPGDRSEARFVREAIVTGQLEHPSIVPVYEASRRPDGTLYYAMKLVGGRSLKQLITETRTLPERLTLLPNVLAVADAVSYAHSKRIIHRDLKPSNVMVGDHGETIVIDWGLAKDLSASPNPAEISADDDGPADHHGASRERHSRDDGLTVAGSVMGTPIYMPPEQARGHPVDERADVYALGAILYHVIAGQPPYHGATPEKLLAQVRTAPPPSIESLETGIAADLAALVGKAMARDPSARYPNAGALADDLRRFLAGQLVRAHDYSAAERAARWIRAHRALARLLAAILVIAVVTGGWVLRREASLRRAAEVARTDLAAQTRALSEQTLALMEAQGTSELAAGRALRAAVLFAEAYSEGRDTFALRLGLGEAMRHVEAVRAVLRGHEHAVVAAAFSPDGARVVTASADKTARVWEAATGNELITLRGHEAEVFSAAFGPDGLRVATASADKTARFWDAATGAELAVLHGHTAGLSSAAFSHDGGALVTSSFDSTARIWDATTGEERLVLRHEAAVFSAAFSPDGARVVTACEDSTARVWDAASGKEVLVVRGHDHMVMSAAFSPDGSRLVTADKDKTAGIWDSESGQSVAFLRGHEAGLFSAAFSPDGTRVVTASADKTVRIWDANTGQLLAIDRGHESSVWSAQFSPDGTLLVTASSDGTARVSLMASQMVTAMPGHLREVRASFGPDTARVLTFSAEGVAQLWGTTTGARVWRRGGLASPWTVAFSPDGRRIVTSDFSGNTPMVLRADTGQVERELHGHTDRVFGVDVSPDGTRIATASHDGTVRIWDADTGELIGELVQRDDSDRPSFFLSAGFSPDSTRVVTGANDGSIRIHDLGTREVVRQLEGHDAAVNTATYSPNGSQILSAGWDDHLAKLWDAETGDLLFTLAGHTDRLFWASFSPDGRVIATAGADQTARFWDASTGALLHELDGPVYSVDFSPDGRSIAVGGYNGYARMLRLETRSPEEIKLVLRDNANWEYRAGTLVRTGQ